MFLVPLQPLRFFSSSRLTQLASLRPGHALAGLPSPRRFFPLSTAGRARGQQGHGASNSLKVTGVGKMGKEYDHQAEANWGLLLGEYCEWVLRLDAQLEPGFGLAQRERSL